MTDARMAALGLLEQILDHRLGLEEAMTRVPGMAQLPDRDRQFARALAMLVLRRLGQIDALLAGFMSKPLPSKMKRVQHILRLGVAQLLWMDTPPHAAVYETVELAAKSKLVSHKNLVNAILQRTLRDGKTAAKSQDAARLLLPGWLWDAWTAAYGEATARAIALAQLNEPPLDLTVKSQPESWAARLKGTLLPTGSVRLRDAGLVTALPGYAQGEWWVQDAAASLPTRLFGNLSGKTVLDLCAAPGGKTAQLACMGAKVIAVDQSERRLAIAKRNLERLHLSSVTWTVEDARTYRPGAPPQAILLDAPCSATGTMRRHPDVMHHRAPADLERLCGIQRELLDHTASLLAPGGTLVYAVCSLQKKEGEDQIAAFLSRHPGFRLLPVTAAEAGDASFVTKEGYLRTLPSHWPERGGLDGFFAARLEMR